MEYLPTGDRQRACIPRDTPHGNAPSVRPFHGTGKLMLGASLGQRVRRGVLNKISRRRSRRLHDFNDRPPVLTLSFDDVPRSAIQEGVPVLQAYDALATFYVCGSYCELGSDGSYATVSDLQAISALGHEIGCHGFGHIDFQQVRPADILRDLDRNATFFAEAGLSEARTFAYPYGRATPRAKSLCAARFDICRGVYPDLSGPGADLNILPSVEFYAASLTPATIEQWLDKLSLSGGVLSFFSHGVTTNPGPFDCTPDQLDLVLRLAKQKGIVVKRMRDVLAETERV